MATKLSKKHLKPSEQLKNEKDVNNKEEILVQDKSNKFEKLFKGSVKYAFVNYCKEICSKDLDVKRSETNKYLTGKMLNYVL